MRTGQAQSSPSSPYGGGTVVKKIYAHQIQPVPSLRAVRPDAPESLDAVFQRKLAKRMATINHPRKESGHGRSPQNLLRGVGGYLPIPRRTSYITRHGHNWLVLKRAMTTARIAQRPKGKRRDVRFHASAPVVVLNSCDFRVMNCGWPMYRIPYGESFRYGCGYYQQSHGAECNHNHVQGPVATRFMLSCLRQRLLSRTLLPKMEQRFRELAAKARDNREADQAFAELRGELAGVQAELKTVSGNMARAKTDAQYDAISATFEELTSRAALLSEKTAEQQSRARHTGDAEREVATALNIVHRLADVVVNTEPLADSDCLDLAGQAFRLTNARLFLRFQPVQVKKRLLNKVAGGVVTFGAVAAPIEIYRGPTGRRALNYSGSMALVAPEPGKPGLPSPPECTIGSGSEGKSLRNVSRGD